VRLVNANSGLVYGGPQWAANERSVAVANGKELDLEDGASVGTLTRYKLGYCAFEPHPPQGYDDAAY
jgi:hypothetical protein